jgi:hypothetical protein
MENICVFAQIRMGLHKYLTRKTFFLSICQNYLKWNPGSQKSQKSIANGAHWSLLASLCGICADSVQSRPACVESVQILYRDDQPACVESVQILCRAGQLVWNLCRYCAEPASLCGICAETVQSRPDCVESVQIRCSAGQLVWNLYV